MTTRKKLEVIKRSLGITQTKLADRLGVSFVAFSGWWNGHSEPRPKKLATIEDLYLEVTGKKVVPPEVLVAKKSALRTKSASHKSIISEILANPDIRDQFVLKLTYHSNSIEGSTLTEPDTAAIIFDNVALPDKSLTEQLEAKNHQTALLYLFDHVLKNGKTDEEFILKLHGMLMNGIRPDAGAYRRHAVRIVGANVPTANYLRLPEVMPIVMGEAEKMAITADHVGLISAVHAKFEQVHPFSDGNGRIGRLLMNAMLLSANIAPAVIRQEQKRLYYTYLNKAQTNGDHSQLEDYLCAAINDGFTILERMDQ